MPKTDKGDSTVLVLCKFCERRVLGHISDCPSIRADMLAHEQGHRDAARRVK